MNRLIFIALVSFLVSCNSSNQQVAKDDVLIASVYDKELYLSSMDGLFGQSQTLQDSQQVVRNYSQKWIREALMLGEAEKNLSESINIKQLVEDYRSSLLIVNYESQLIDQELDTVITASQLDSYYKANKDQYLLSRPIVKFDFAKIIKKTKGLDQFYSDWRKDRMEKVNAFCIKNAEFYQLADTTWHLIEELSALMPADLFRSSSLKKKQDLQKARGNYEYFVKIGDFMDKQEIPPLAYIEDKIKKVILHNRKISLLNKIREQLYNKEILTNKVKIYPLKSAD